uniref:DEAD-box ATP-dependent RNA helicase RhpA n=1 Tax=uncultured Thiotrichaceae bacterium TaxID=298394 RepID=A0A6S6UNX0_9GAMM|nr:MAG: ATP-dependent RNA helicase RhlE [uncultured Thiotrichaceae bacterium]
MSFSALGLCDELLKTVAEQAYITPSAIQAAAIPVVLSRRDVMAVAQTGTGKTAGFTLPVLQLLAGSDSPAAKSVRALVIAPTRELAAQVEKNIKSYSRYMNLRTAAVFGGVRIEPQIGELAGGLDILVATPGRLLDLYERGAFTFDQLEILVLDEADRMLDLGFIEDIEHIQMLLPKERQTLMFSATFSEAIKSLAKGLLNNPELIEVTAANSTVEAVKQKVHPVDQARKSELLIDLIKRNKWSQVLVFCRTKRGADSLVADLESIGMSADSIHANRTQFARTRALEGFRSGSLTILVATDIASRGIDVDQLPCVINFDLPYVPEDYVHRIGRTGRAGTAGLAISLFSEEEAKQLQSIERFIGRQFKRLVVPGFEPTQKAPVDDPSADGEYGNFEADAKPRKRGRGFGRGGKSSGRRRK